MLFRSRGGRKRGMSDHESPSAAALRSAATKGEVESPSRGMAQDKGKPRGNHGSHGRNRKKQPPGGLQSTGSASLTSFLFFLPHFSVIFRAFRGSCPSALAFQPRQESARPAKKPNVSPESSEPFWAVFAKKGESNEIPR